MKTVITNIIDLKEILKKDNIDNDIFEIASRFGAIKNSLRHDDELSAQINDIENILKKSLTQGTFHISDKLELFSMIGAIEGHLKNTKSQEDDLDRTLNATAAGMTASAGARVLMKAGPMGMLAAGVLGVAGYYIMQKNEEPHIANKDLLVIAYYLSRFDHENLFGMHISSAKALDALGNVLNVKPNTIRGKRDYFDSIIDKKDRKSERKGYSDIKSTKVYDDIIEKYSYITNNDEKEMRKVVVEVLQKYQDSLKL